MSNSSLTGTDGKSHNIHHTVQMWHFHTSIFRAFQKCLAAEVVSRLHALGVDLFTEGFQALDSHWDKCLSRSGDHVER
jgi:hypothetical protein